MAKSMAAASPVDGRWALPNGWVWRRARDLGKIVGGSTPKNASDPANYSDDGIPWLTPADLSGYSRATIDAGRRNLAPHVVNRSALLPAGAVLISSRAPVGYCAVAQNPMVTNQGFRSLVLTNDVDPFFIRYYILFSRRYLEDNASGTTFKELSGSALGDLAFPVPPIDDQRRIVARIDELFAEIDDGEAALARARGDLATWRKALLKAAVTGELTADWRAANPQTERGADLLARILAERRSEPKRKGKKSIEALQSEDKGDRSLPEGWSRCGPDEIVEWSSGKFMPDRSMNGGDVPVYGGNGIAGYHDEPLVREPTLVIGRVGHYCGNAYATDGAAWISDNAIYASKVATGIAVHYLRLVFEQVNLRRMAQGGAQPFVSQMLLNSISIPLPGAQEQAVILKAVEDGLAEARDLSLFMEEANARSSKLRQSILAAAFCGDLA